MNDAKLLFDELLLGNHEFAKTLVLEGTDANYVLPEGAAPIHLAAGLETVPEDIICLLLRHGADPNVRSYEGDTPLHVSAAYGRYEVLRLLLLSGADPDVRNQDGQTAADLACQSGCEVCMLTLEDFVASGDDRNDEHTAFSLEPYDPPFFSSLQSSGRGIHNGDSTLPITISPSDSLESDRNPESNKETSGSTLNSSTSFHTCEDDNDGTVQFSLKDNYGNQAPKSSKENCSAIPTTIHSTLPVPTQERNSITMNRDHYNTTNSPTSFNQIHRWQSSSDCNDKTAASSGDRTLDYSPGSSLNRSCTKSASTPTKLECKSPARVALTKKKSFCDTEKEKRNHVFLDDTISSVGSAAFVPTEFNSSDLSLRIDPLARQQSCYQQKRPQRTVLSKLEDKADFKQELHSNTDQDLWYRQLHHYDDTLSLCELDVHTTKLPRSSSRNNSTIHSELLANLSLSTINESNYDRIESWKSKCTTNDGSNHAGSLPPFPISSRICTVPSSCQADIGLKTTANKPVLRVNGYSKTGSQMRHWSLESGSSLSSRNSSTSSIGPIHCLYTDDEDGYSLIESWYPVQDEDIITTPTPLISQRHVILSPRQCPMSPIYRFVDRDHLASESKTPKRRKNPLESDRNQGISQRNQGITNQGISGNYLNLSDTISLLSLDGGSGDYANRNNQASTKETTNHCHGEIPEHVKKLSDLNLRKGLIAIGITPGPINDDTRALYQQKLWKLQCDPSQAKLPANSYLPEIQRLLGGDLDTSGLQNLEDQMARPFIDIDPARKWREGTRKFSFNYLLLDPRITNNLPARVKTIGDVNAFRDFIKAIFYIGKGKRARPYAHFKEAIQHKTGEKSKVPGEKVKKIMDVWSDGQGVISLHVFQNVIPVEAYTREAAMIDTIGRQKLTNIKAGEYYGPAASWTVQQKRALGARLLHKSYRIFLSEGERHIRPADIQGT